MCSTLKRGNLMQVEKPLSIFFSFLYLEDISAHKSVYHIGHDTSKRSKVKMEKRSL